MKYIKLQRLSFLRNSSLISAKQHLSFHYPSMNFLLQHKKISFLPFNAFSQKDPKNEKNEENSDQKEKKEKEESPKTKENEQKTEETGEKEQKESPKPFDFKKAYEYFMLNRKFEIFGFNLRDLRPKHYFGLFIFTLFLANLLYSYLSPENYIPFTEFIKKYVDTNSVKKIQIIKSTDGFFQKTYAVVYLHTGEQKYLSLGNVDHFLEVLEKNQISKSKSSDLFIPVEFKYQIDYKRIFDQVLSVGVFFISLGFLYSIFISLKSMGSGNDIMGVGKSNAKIFGIDSKINVKFKDVAGLDEAKTEINEFVDFLKKPQKYKDLGARLPKGALLTGPPGTGKTMLAKVFKSLIVLLKFCQKACAGEADVPFFYISGSDFVEMFVGVGAARVRDLFKKAKEKSPSIIFIDEIDAVGRKRESKLGGGHDERDNTLNQLLVEMDGFGTDSSVVVLGATNKKEILDQALTRPGRFDRIIDVTLPDISGRREIFLVHLAPLKLDPSKTIDEYARRLATLTPGFSGADIANLCNEAAIHAARKNRRYVESMDFELSSERVLAGLEKKRIVSEEERKIVAVHESGHAVTSWFLEGGAPLLKLTIIPRSKGSLGFAQYLPNENSLETKEELFDRLCCMLGGRVAEETFFGKITTGAADDLQKVYELATTIVKRLGMSEKIGYLSFKDDEIIKIYSEQTQKIIDDEILRIIQEATVRTREIIKKHKSEIEKLSNKLLEVETLDLKSIIEILGERPFPPKKNFKQYLDTKSSEQN